MVATLIIDGYREHLQQQENHYCAYMSCPIFRMSTTYAEKPNKSLQNSNRIQTDVLANLMCRSYIKVLVIRNLLNKSNDSLRIKNSI